MTSAGAAAHFRCGGWSGFALNATAIELNRTLPTLPSGVDWRKVDQAGLGHATAAGAGVGAPGTLTTGADVDAAAGVLCWAGAFASECWQAESGARASAARIGARTAK